MSPSGRPAPAELAVVPTAVDPPQGLRLRWIGLRNRLLASPGFQRWASAFPLSRPIARRRARELFDLCAGFVYSQILYACIDARLFERLADGPRRVEDLAGDLELSETAALRLLKAAASLRLIEPVGEAGYALGELGAALLGNGGISEMVRHHRMLYRDLDDPMAMLRGERPQGDLGTYWAYAESAQPGALDQAQTTGYTDLMAASQGLISGDLLDACSLRERRCLLDIGGGNGAFLAAVAARWPHLQLKLFDLPPVAEQARQRFAREGLAGRAQAFGGDLFRDRLPEGADCCSLVRVIHDHDDGPALAILKAAHRALPSGGVLLLGEPMSGTPGAEPIGDAYFGFYLLAMGSGRPRTAEELTAMLHQAGFARVREQRTRRPLLTRLLVAHVN